MRASAAYITAVAMAVVCMVLVVENYSHESTQEVSKESGWIPCFLGGTCKTPSPERAKAWAKSKSRGDVETSLPCMLGGNCQLPRQRRVQAWKSQRRELRRAKFRHLQRLAARNGLPAIPRSKSYQQREVEMSTSTSAIQQEERKHVLSVAKDRLDALTLQLSTISIKPRKLPEREAQRLVRRQMVGQGLLAHADAVVNSMDRFPKSQKHLHSIVAEVRRAVQSKKVAKQMMASAETLQKASKKKIAAVKKLSANIQPVMDLLKTEQKNTDKARRQQNNYRRKVRYMKRKVQKTKRDRITKEILSSSQSLELVEDSPTKDDEESIEEELGGKGELTDR